MQKSSYSNTCIGTWICFSNGHDCSSGIELHQTEIRIQQWGFTKEKLKNQISVMQALLGDFRLWDQLSEPEPAQPLLGEVWPKPWAEGS